MNAAAPAAAEPPDGLRAEREPGTRPELGAEHAEREVGVREEALEHAVPLRPELAGVAVGVAQQERRLAVREGGRRRQLGVQVLEPAAARSSPSCACAAPPTQSGCQALKTSWWKPGSVISAVWIAPPSQSLRSSTHTRQPASREQRAARERVDAAADEDGVVVSHRRRAAGTRRR